MGARTAATTLAKRTTFSSAINILPSELTGLDGAQQAQQQNHLRSSKDDSMAAAINETSIKPYSSIPGPKELPIIGNSWRFAPIIGKL